MVWSCKTKNRKPGCTRAGKKEMETHDWKGCLLLSFLSRQPAKNYFLPSPRLSLSLSHHSQISLSPLPPFLSLNPARLAVLAFRRSPSRIPPPLRRRCSCLPASAVPEAAAGSSAAGVEPAASGGWVGLPDGYRFLIYPDPGSAAKAAPFVGCPRHAGGFGASAVRRAGPLV